MAAPVFQLHPEDGPPPEEARNDTEVLPAPSAPLDVARVLLEELHEEGQTTLRRWRGGWWRYQGPHWSEVETEGVRKWLYLRLEKATYYAKTKDGELELKPWAPNRSKIDGVLDALAAPTLLPTEVEAPVWLHNGEPGAGYVPCANGLVDVNTRKLHPTTPRYFGTSSVPFDYDPDAGEPAEWLGFLRTLWPAHEDGTDADEILALQEWFGYVLSGRMDLQKILLVVGPPRSGKSTIARVLQGLMGKANVAHPTLASMATNFGLAPLLGRPLAIVGDARLQSQGQETVVERLLSISGEDSLTVDRKNRDAWHGRIPSRIVIISNELPRFGDASGAIAARFVVLTLQESFLGREDVDLGDRLNAELAAILKWGLDGMTRLNARKRFTEPAASVEAVQALADLVSPISAFLREVCVVDSEETVAVSKLYREYGEWCKENGRGVSSAQKLSSDLRTVLPKLSDYRPKVDGKNMPRHYRGLSVSTEWATREKDNGREDEWKVGGWS
ncbi:MAG: phage/plasmid primase, P4 family [Pseudonocardia sp.]|nr:phage/plasmid primase, P4 family [Pseudonocardia sp.]